MELLKAFECECGKIHDAAVEEALVGEGMLYSLPEMLTDYSIRRPFILSDKNTERAAGERVKGILSECGFAYAEYVFPESPKPDERAVGSVMMRFDNTCDCVLTVGSGVLNDLGKLTASVAGLPYFLVATAASMDGFASDTSAMERDGWKVSLKTKCATAVIGDTDILSAAPADYTRAGIGDMMAKIISLAEWKISKIINGEYYCRRVADTMKAAMWDCLNFGEAALAGDADAVGTVFSGLVLGGVCMNYAGVSRPASGTEHYVSHLYDMRGLDKGTPVNSHGVQCALGVRLAAAAYEKLRDLKPDRESALAFVKNFDREAWFAELRAFVGKAAESMIAAETADKKYDPACHEARLESILAHWDEIRQVICEDVPTLAETDALLDRFGLPKTPEEAGIETFSPDLLLKLCADVRNKYILPRLMFDLGVRDTVSVGELWK